MRLAILLLSAAAAVTAQTPRLPWVTARPLPWSPGPPGPVEPAGPAPAPAELSLAVTLSADGALRITDAKGIIQLRLGLPGRVLKIWRDGGTEVDPGSRVLAFPIRTPLQAGVAGMGLGSADFRPALAGLLWILDDDERVLTVIHPATARVAHLALPGGHGVNLVFHPDRLEALNSSPESRSHREDASWSLPWLALLPQLVELGQPKPRPVKEGGALVPFPKE